MNKKITIIIASITIFISLVLGLSWYVVHADDAWIIDEDAVKKPNFLKNQRAVLYFSPPDYADIFQTGYRYAVFVDKQGEAKGLRINAMDTGTVVTGAHRLYVDESDKVRIIGDRYKEFPVNGQGMGGGAGYLTKKKMFFSLYPDNNNTQIRYGNEKGFHTKTIPYFVSASGSSDDAIYIVTENPDDDKNDHYGIKEIHLDQHGMKVKAITTLRIKNEPSPITIQADHQYLYVLMCVDHDERNGKVSLIRINKKTHQHDQFTLASYKDVSDIYNITMAYDRKAAYLRNNKLVYVDDLGYMYTFNTKTEKMEDKILLKDSQSGELTTFHGDYLYLYSQDEKTRKHSINQYQLQTGQLVNHQEIKGMDKIFSTKIINFYRNATLYSYDFEIIN
ncbi:hypothetical protein [Marininema halotolerans]|uniref:Lactonase, 7-bladed beta-propeller n=1 Tax=Marininema halotolerans TaxID=1155944 RepID=A0A1I6PC78_9BACL|nr:hypothetical protein [Marininema halotolerans]SFS37750.1 Lactonase, 7-bladed beta-propeller [Marininema halotolerans]